MEDNKYISKQFSKSDVIELLQLYKNAFGFNADPDQVSRKFFHKYQQINASFYSFSDRITSFYGMIVQKASYNDTIFIIGQSCDSMTHQDHGGKGLFVNLANEVYNYLEKENIGYVFGFPNTTIYNLRIKKLLWQHNENIHVFKLKIKTFPLAKIVKKLPILKNTYNHYLKIVFGNCTSKLLFFNNSVLEKNVAGILHDADYFDYKKNSNKFIIRVNDIHLWIKIDGFLWVGDFEPTSENNFNEVLKKLKRLAIFAGCNSVVFHFQEGTPNESLLNGILQLDSKMPVGFICLNDKYKNMVFKFSGSDFDSW